MKKQEINALIEELIIGFGFGIIGQLIHKLGQIKKQMLNIQTKARKK